MTKMKNKKRTKNKCEKCGYEWFQWRTQKERPLYCAKCGKPYWWIPKEKTKEG